MNAISAAICMKQVLGGYKDEQGTNVQLWRPRLASILVKAAKVKIPPISHSLQVAIELTLQIHHVPPGMFSCLVDGTSFPPVAHPPNLSHLQVVHFLSLHPHGQVLLILPSQCLSELLSRLHAHGFIPNGLTSSASSCCSPLSPPASSALKPSCSKCLAAPYYLQIKPTDLSKSFKAPEIHC